MAAASPSTGSPVSAAESSQSATADRLLTTSPIPASTASGGAPHPVQVHDHGDRQHHSVGARALTRARSVLTGEAMPSCARLVATATMGMPANVRGELGDVDGPAAADASHRLVRASPELVAERRLRCRGCRRPTRNTSPASSPQLGGDRFALAGARQPPRPGPRVAIRRSASRSASPAIAPGRTSMTAARRAFAPAAAWPSSEAGAACPRDSEVPVASPTGVPVPVQAGSGSDAAISPGPAQVARGCRPRPSRRRRSAGRRPAPPRAANSAKPSS